LFAAKVAQPVPEYTQPGSPLPTRTLPGSAHWSVPMPFGSVTDQFVKVLLAFQSVRFY